MSNIQRIKIIEEIGEKGLRFTWGPCSSNSPQTGAVLYDLLYDNSKKHYLKVDGYGEWIPITESLAKNHLQVRCNVSTSNKDENGEPKISELARALSYVSHHQNIEYAGKLAGYSAGVYEVAEGRRILITSSPKIINPVEGNWPTIKSLLDGQFDEEQFFYFCAWLKFAYEALRDGTRKPGQCLALIGPADCGKTFDQDHIITPIIGGRVGKPYQYMTGKTPFNSDFCGSEHLIMSDENPMFDYNSRYTFGSKIKDLLVNPDQRIHPKNKDAFTVQPFWRMSISLNDDSENLRMLPPIDPSMEDKLMILKVKRPRCLPRSSEERPGFAKAIRDELPAFVYWLLGMQIPADKLSGRFGVTHYHEPSLVKELNELAPEQEVLGLMDVSGIFRVSHEWEGTAGSLYQTLTQENSPVYRRVVNLWRSAKSLGKYLSRLVHTTPDRVSVRILHGNKVYTVLGGVYA